MKLKKYIKYQIDIKYIESNIAKNIGIIFRSKLYLIKNCLISLYYSSIYSYISYANMLGETPIYQVSKE